MLKVIRYLLGIGFFLLLSSTAMAQGPQPQHTDPVWQASYWDNKYLKGTATLQRTENAIDHDWGYDAPGPGIENDGFSARWTRYIDVPSARSFKFNVTCDDGMRVFVDNQLILDEWHDQRAMPMAVEKNLSAGHHLIVVEYYDNAYDAVAKFWMSPELPTAFVYWKGEYFNNPTLSGTPALVRDDLYLDFQWNEASPAPGTINPDNFSARWTRSIDLPVGNYRFTLTGDDGVRLWVNGHLLIDSWQDQWVHTYTGNIWLPGGAIPVKLEYYEHTGGAFAELSWAAAGAVANWRGEYYNNMSLAGSPALVRDDANINFGWGENSPAIGLIGLDNFSVRWTRSLNLPAGNYHFALTIDDGARLWVNGHLLIDSWQEQWVHTYNGDIWLPGGDIPIKLEYYEKTGGAFAILNWTQDAAIANWRGEYFNNVTLSGTPALVRDDAAINFDWGGASPAAGKVSADRFSVRWTRNLNFAAGVHRFTLTSDDGARLWVNGHLLINAWKDQSATTYTANISLPGGSVPVKLEYYENAYNATIRLAWGAPTSTGPQTVIVDDMDVGFEKGGRAESWRSAPWGMRDHMFWTYNNSTTRNGYNWARWYPALQPGRYEVYALVPEMYSTSSQARYWVAHAAGLTLRIVDQNGNGNRWLSLGTYRFSGTRTDYVSLADVTYEPYLTRMVAWDAMKWEPR